MAKEQDDAYARLAAEEAKKTRAFYVKQNAQDILEIAHEMGNASFDPETANALAASWTERMDDNNRRASGKKEGMTFRDWATQRINAKPSLVGLGGAEITDVDKTKLAQAMNGNATVLAQLVREHGLPKMNAIARSGGRKDIFDKLTPWRLPGHTSRAGEVEDKKPAGHSGEPNPFKPGPTFSLTAGAKLWQSDPTQAKRLMQEAGVARLGMTEKEILQGRR